MEFPPSISVPKSSSLLRLKRGGLVALLALVCLAPTGRGSVSTPVSPEDSDFFEKEIRPLLEERCLECHSQKSNKTKGGLSLDSRQSLLKGGESGPAASPGDTEKSRILIAVRRHDTDLQMPPKNPLTASQVDALTEWVKRGLPDPRTESLPKESPAVNAAGMTLEEGRAFWSFKPVVRPAPPQVRQQGWVHAPADAFILARLEQEKLPTAEKADQRTLLCQVTFDLTGLPPNPQEVESFERNSSPDALAKVVDRLQQSPAYGERWGRH